MTLYEFDKTGRLIGEDNIGEHFTITVGKKKQTPESSENYTTDLVMDYYEWYYDAVSDKWGLRDISSGENQIDPVFDYVRVEPQLHVTLVGMKKPAKFTFDRTTYRFEMVFGLVENITGEVLTEMQFRSIKLSDCQKTAIRLHTLRSKTGNTA